MEVFQVVSDQIMDLVTRFASHHLWELGMSWAAMSVV